MMPNAYGSELSHQIPHDSCVGNPAFIHVVKVTYTHSVRGPLKDTPHLIQNSLDLVFYQGK